MTRIIGILLVFCSSVFGGIIDPPVNSAVRQSIQYASEYDIQSQVTGSGDWYTGGFSGWGFPCGVHTNFEAVGFYLKAIDTAFVPSVVYAVVREGGTNGTIVATGSTNIAVTIGEPFDVVVPLDSYVANASKTNLYVSFHTDGNINLYTLSSVQYTNAATLYWTTKIVPPSAGGVESVSRKQTIVRFLVRGSSKSTRFSQLMRRLIAEDSIISKIVSPIWGMTKNHTVGSASTSIRSSLASYTGWGEYVGPVTNEFNAVNVSLFGFSETAIPRRVRVTIKQMPSDTNTWVSVGARNYPVIATGTANFTTDVNLFKRVVVQLDRTVTPSGYIWVDWISDGLDAGNLSLGASVPGLLTAYTVSEFSNTSPSWVFASSHSPMFVQLGLATGEVSDFSVTDEFADKLNVQPVETPTSIILPAKIFARANNESSLYFNNFIRTDKPLSQQMVDVHCARGEQWDLWGGYWRYTPTTNDIGLVIPLIVSIKDAVTGDASVTDTTSLTVVSDQHPGTPVTRRVLCVGDSTWGGGGRAALAECYGRSTLNTNFTLLLVGSNTGSASDSTGVSRALACDAIAGWKATFFLTNTTDIWTTIGGSSRTGSPFIVSGVFNIPAYLSTYSVTLASNDWVLINLGMNPAIPPASDASMLSSVAAELDATDVIISAFKAAVPGIRIGVLLTSPCNSSQNAFAKDYGCGYIRNRVHRNLGIWMQQNNDKYGGRESERIYVWAYGHALDPVNGFEFTTMPISKYWTNAVTVSQRNSGVHPYVHGYYQLGDNLYTMILGYE